MSDEEISDPPQVKSPDALNLREVEALEKIANNIKRIDSTLYMIGFFAMVLWFLFGRFGH